jgi:type II secretory pathway component PulC
MTLVGLLVLGGGAWAGEEGDARNSPGAPPFLVSGTIVSPPTRIALIVILDEQGKAVGEVKVHEGDTVKGYRVVKIDPERVLFERDGQPSPIRVGNAHHPVPVNAPVTPYERRKERPVNVVPPPDNIEDVKKQTETFMQQLRDSSEFQKGIAEVKRRLRERSAPPNANP